LGEAGDGQGVGFAGGDEGGRGGGEGEQAAEQDWASADPVGQSAEDGLRRTSAPS
jgi:hypothetical protein